MGNKGIDENFDKFLKVTFGDIQLIWTKDFYEEQKKAYEEYKNSKEFKQREHDLWFGKEQDDKREFLCYTGDGKGNLVPIEQTERFSEMMKEYIQKMYPDKKIVDWDENSREIL